MTLVRVSFGATEGIAATKKSSVSLTEGRRKVSAYLEHVPFEVECVGDRGC